MRIGLISDTHIPEAMPELWPHVFEAFHGCELILHAGDIYDLAVIEGLSEVAPVRAARGNGDDGSGGRAVQPDDERLREAWLIDVDGVAIGLTHAVPVPEFASYGLEDAIERFFPERRPDVIVHGDTHVEDIRTVREVLCVNPGSPTFPHNLSMQLGTIGFLDIEARGVSASIWQLTETGTRPFDWDTWRRPW